MLCSSQLYGKIFFSKTPWPKVLAHMRADDDAGGISLPMRLAAHPFPLRHASLSEVLKIYRLPLSLLPNRCQLLDLAFRLTPGVETLPNYINRPQTWEKYKTAF